MANFKPRHSRDTGKFQPKEHNPERDRKQALYRGNSSWRNYCARFLAVNRRCYACGKPATVVDHLVPHKGDEKLFQQLNNHIPLCERDHNYVSAKFDARYVVGHSIQNKVNWLNSRRVPMEDWNPEAVKVLTKYEE